MRLYNILIGNDGPIKHRGAQTDLREEWLDWEEHIFVGKIFDTLILQKGLRSLKYSSIKHSVGSHMEILISSNVVSLILDGCIY